MYVRTYVDVLVLLAGGRMGERTDPTMLVA